MGHKAWSQHIYYSCVVCRLRYPVIIIRPLRKDKLHLPSVAPLSKLSPYHRRHRPRKGGYSNQSSIIICQRLWINSYGACDSPSKRRELNRAWVAPTLHIRQLLHLYLQGPYRFGVLHLGRYAVIGLKKFRWCPVLFSSRMKLHCSDSWLYHDGRSSTSIMSRADPITSIMSSIERHCGNGIRNPNTDFKGT